MGEGKSRDPGHECAAQYCWCLFAHLIAQLHRMKYPKVARRVILIRPCDRDAVSQKWMFRQGAAKTEGTKRRIENATYL